MANNAKHTVGPYSVSGSKPLFGTDGIRGRAGTVLNPELILQIGYLCGLVISEKGPFLIGQDSRTSGSMVVSALTAGLTAAGKEVWHIGLCPTPAVPHLIKVSGGSGGIMVSASHNPPSDNGIKIFGSNGKKITSSQQRFIEEGLKEKKNIFGNFGKSFQRHDLLKKYERSLTESIKNEGLTDLSIVLDLCWGSATSCGERVFKKLGADLSIINGQPDGMKINVGCGSTKLDGLKKAVIQNNAQMGFAFDGDADRMIAVDEKGRVIDGDHILYLWGSDLKERNQLPQKRLVATTMSNLGFEKAWKDKGGILERTPVGDQHVQAAMMATNASLGGEQSGHILSTMNDLCGDGLLTAIQIANICKRQNLRLAEWLDQSFKPYPQKLINIPLTNKEIDKSWKDSIPLQEALQEAKSSMGDEGRVLIRESGTEPLLRVMVESQNQAMVDSWSSHLALIAQKELNAA